MRVYDISLFLFIFNLMLGMVTGLVDGAIIDLAETKEPLDNYNNEDVQAHIDTTKNQTLGAGGVESEPNFIVESIRYVTIAIPKFMGLLYNITFGLPAMLNAFGMPDVIVIPIGAIIMLVYLIGILQLVLGRSVRDAQ
jgi:hypothetical protein